jgi:hypothetical protein
METGMNNTNPKFGISEGLPLDVAHEFVKANLERLLAEQRLKDKTRWSASELLRTNFPEPKWIVPGIIPEGLSVIGGRPKIGKSFFVLQLSTAKAQGCLFLDKQLEKGNVLYIALEDNPRRLKDRLCKQGIINQDISGLTFETRWPGVKYGGIDSLAKEIESSQYSLVIIDTISRFMGSLDQMDMAVTNETFGAIQSIALANNTSVLGVDHHRKTFGDIQNPVDDLFGSTGKSAPLDTVIGIYKQAGKSESILKAVGRDIEEQELVISLDPISLKWTLVGKNSEVHDNTYNGIIVQGLQNLADIGQTSVTGSCLADFLSLDQSHVSRALHHLVGMGIVIKGKKVGREQPYSLIGNHGLDGLDGLDE